ncbi:hypothetical protein VP01_65g3 [Puccinia sorghi]|uniref:Uncharacterized protein n=1 Tax=Puccinia sorghi TaxID=27349 RepID=A0A0L6UG14_9BASI|nr:hypothetical protein VP01_65g3 [Puccinia sorghi]
MSHNLTPKLKALYKLSKINIWKSILFYEGGILEHSATNQLLNDKYLFHILMDIRKHCMIPIVRLEILLIFSEILTFFVCLKLHDVTYRIHTHKINRHIECLSVETIIEKNSSDMSLHVYSLICLRNQIKNIKLQNLDFLPIFIDHDFIKFDTFFAFMSCFVQSIQNISGTNEYNFLLSLAAYLQNLFLFLSPISLFLSQVMLFPSYQYLENSIFKNNLLILETPISRKQKILLIMITIHDIFTHLEEKVGFLIISDLVSSIFSIAIIKIKKNKNGKAMTILLHQNFQLSSSMFLAALVVVSTKIGSINHQQTLVVSVLVLFLSVNLSNNKVVYISSEIYWFEIGCCGKRNQNSRFTDISPLICFNYSLIYRYQSTPSAPTTPPSPFSCTQGVSAHNTESPPISTACNTAPIHLHHPSGPPLCNPQTPHLSAGLVQHASFHVKTCRVTCSQILLNYMFINLKLNQQLCNSAMLKHHSNLLRSS